MDSIEKCREDIIIDLKKNLSVHLPHHEASQIYRYALLPPGKLFRPLLVRSVAWDERGYRQKSHSFLELFVEIHHVYTLVHDDLPCMDDDSMRRGRESIHRKFNEWKALLVGDGLNTLSYRILSLIESHRLPLLLRYVTWALGPKGLILGQYEDLSSGPNSFKKLMVTYNLKTSRLIQTALVGSSLLCENTPLKKIKDLHRLGEHLGIGFQLLDDLCELTLEEASNHESQINPFLHHPDFCAQEPRNSIAKNGGHPQYLQDFLYEKGFRRLSKKDSSPHRRSRRDAEKADREEFKAHSGNFASIEFLR